MTEHSTGLPSALRRWLEQVFGTDLGVVRVHRGAAAARTARDAGGIACALEGREILLGPVPAPLLPAVLAHEVAHLLQQRRRGPPGAQDAEAEAHRAAAAALAGRRHVPRAALDPHLPACWEDAGHYYTVYFVGLAAGLPNDNAQQIAFFSQLPDEMADFDACEHAASKVADVMARSVDIETPTQTAVLERSMEVDRKMNAVHRGLHCLTGRDAQLETDRRRAISLTYDPVSQAFEFGLSLHAYGDSYAHRDGRRMFPPLVGHGLTSDGGHKPDMLDQDRLPIYQAYVGGLYDIFRTAWKNTGPVSHRSLSAQKTVEVLGRIVPRIDHAALRALALEQAERRMATGGRYSTGGFAGEERAIRARAKPDGKVQCDAIRGLASQELGVAMKPYAPEALYWAAASDKFLSEHWPRDIPVPTDLMSRAIRLAEEWASR